MALSCIYSYQSKSSGQKLLGLLIRISSECINKATLFTHYVESLYFFKQNNTSSNLYTTYLQLVEWSSCKHMILVCLALYLA